MQNQSSELLTDLFQAYYDARQNKRNTVNALAFEIDYERKLFELHQEISERRYRPGQSICFIVNHPVKREIFAATFRDRVVHHLLFNYLNPLCERLFIYDSYACRTDKGTSLGIQRAAHFIRSCSRNYRQDCYILKLDIAGYFMSINQDILYQKVKKILSRFSQEIGDQMDLLIYLLRVIIFHNPTKNFRRKGKRSDWQGLPKNKSLFYAAPHTGLPIGNLTSQLFGNIYLNDFDHFVTYNLAMSDTRERESKEFALRTLR
jgi:retron-type reverse transcriptase